MSVRKCLKSSSMFCITEGGGGGGLRAGACVSVSVRIGYAYV